MDHRATGLAFLGLLLQGCSSSPSVELAPTPTEPVLAPLVSPAELEAAVERSLPLLQSSMETWIQEVDCMSCHHQGLGTQAMVLARERGFEVDEGLFERQLERMTSEAVGGALHGNAGINGTFGRSFQLVALGAAGIPRDHATDALAHFLRGNASAGMEDPELSWWHSTSYRPPLEASPVTGTAMALRAMDLYRPDARAEEFDALRLRGRHWLEAYEPRDAEERAMRLWGLRWAGASRPALEKATEGILAAQQEDGGWAQLVTMESDAYATGQALVTLQQAAGLSPSSRAYQRGLRYLLDTQHEDGSWLVETRRRAPGLPYFETGFPHRMHQFISTAATAWATMALGCGLDPAPSAAFLGPRPPRHELEPELELGPVHLAAAFGTFEDLRRALDAGGDPDAPGAWGLRPLHLAARDADLVELLLERGAEVDARSEFGTTPLILAAWYGEGSAAAGVLLEHGAVPTAQAEGDGMTPLLFAVRSGKRDLARELLSRDADLERVDAEGQTPLFWACAGNDPAMAALLLEAGAEVDHDLDGFTPLHMVSFDGDAELVRLLLAHGADPDLVFEEASCTALGLAARVEHGDIETLEALLDGGADPTLTAPGGKSPLEWARFFENELAVARLEALAGP